MCADVHSRRRPDEQYALRQIIDIAIEEEVKQVLAAGDLIDRQTNRAESINVWHRQLDRLENAKIEFLFVEGQHDLDDPPWLAGHRWAEYVHKKVFPVGGKLTAYGISYQNWGDLQAALAEVPEGVEFLMMHQVWGDWMGDIAAPQGDFAQVPGHIKWLLTGDLHQCCIETHKNAGGKKMTVISPGATCKQKVDEPNEHFVIIMDKSGNLIKKKLRSRPYIESELIQDEETLDEFLKTIGPEIGRVNEANQDLPEDVRKPVVRVQFGHRMFDAAPRVERGLQHLAILKFKQLPPPERIEAAKARGEARKNGEAVTPLSVLAKRVDREKRPTLYNAAERLLRSQDPEEEFRRWWAEQLQEEA